MPANFQARFTEISAYEISYFPVLFARRSLKSSAERFSSCRMVTIKRKRRKIRIGSRCLPKNKHGNEPASFRFDLPWSRGNDCLSVKQRSTRWREAIQEWTMASNQPRICTGGRPVVYSKIDFDLAPRETV